MRENKIIFYCSIVQFVLEWDNIIVLSMILPFSGDQFNLTGEFETNVIFAALSVVGGIGNVIQGILIMPYLKKHKIRNINILACGCVLRIIGLYFLAMTVILYDYRIEISIMGVFLLGIGSIGTPANFAIASHYLNKTEQGVGLGVINSYKAIAQIIGPASMGYIYWLFSRKNNKIYDLPSIHWYICMLFRFIILIVIMGPFYALLKRKRKETEVILVKESENDRASITELVLPKLDKMHETE